MCFDGRYIVFRKRGKEIMYCLDIKTKKLAWKHSVSGVGRRNNSASPMFLADLNYGYQQNIFMCDANNIYVIKKETGAITTHKLSRNGCINFFLYDNQLIVVTKNAEMDIYNLQRLI